MKIENLLIERKPSYHETHPHQLLGIIQLSGPTGKQEIILSNGSLARIFELIRQDVIATAKANAAQTEHALDEAAAEHQLAYDPRD